MVYFFVEGMLIDFVVGIRLMKLFFGLRLI